MPSGRDPMGGYRFSLRDKRGTRCAEIMLKQLARPAEPVRQVIRNIAVLPPPAISSRSFVWFRNHLPSKHYKEADHSKYPEAGPTTERVFRNNSSWTQELIGEISGNHTANVPQTGPLARSAWERSPKKNQPGERCDADLIECECEHVTTE